MTAVQLGLASYDPDRVQGAVLDRAELDRQIELYRSRDAEARRGIVGLQSKRAEVILAGACGERPGSASRVAGSPVRHLIPAG
jgi:exopolyphosphatase/guanosine-5'-triphosphate,3'-diphosphate pyrophosphatase